MTLTKADISNKIIEEFELDKKIAENFVDNLFEAIKEGIKENGIVKISNFGKFEAKHKSARIGRNPKTGKEYEISARTVVSFKPAQVLKDKIASAKS